MSYPFTPKSGLLPNRRLLPNRPLRRGRGMGDQQTLALAQQYLQDAGYSGVSCRTERVYFPGVDPNTGLNYYENDVCNVPGYLGAFDASTVASSSTAAHPGYGVDLAAERAYLMAQGDGPGTGQDYYTAFGSAPNVQVIEMVDTGGQYSQGQSIPYSANNPQLADYFRGRTETTLASATGGAGSSTPLGPTGSEPATQTLGQSPSLSIDFSGLKDAFGGINPLWLAGGAALVLFLMMKK